MEITKYFKAVEEGNIAALIKSHQDSIDWRKDQTQCNIVKESIRFNERAIELLKANDIIQYSIEYAKLKIPTNEGEAAFFIAGHKRHDPSKPTWIQSKVPTTTIHVQLGSEEDVMNWIRNNADRLHGVYGQLEWQEQHAAFDDVHMVVI